MTAAIETSALAKRYRKVQALNGLDLVVPEGSVCGFLGPNGAGKTTTMRILMGLARPSAGSVRMLGQSIDANSLAVRSRIGYLSQDPAYYPRFQVRNVLRFVARRYLTGSRADIETRVERTLEQVGLADKAKRRVKALSGGERQRLGIGQAVIGRPELLILDEPTVGLDPEGRFQVLNLIDSLRTEMTIFYSSHILDDVQRIADRVVILNHGEIIAQGPMDEFLGSGASYRVVVDGGATRLNSLLTLPWVDDITSVGPGAWDVAVSDQDVAVHRLLPALIEDCRADVREMRQIARSLEDIYVGAVSAAADEEGSE